MFAFNFLNLINQFIRLFCKLFQYKFFCIYILINNTFFCNFSSVKKLNIFAIIFEFRILIRNWDYLTLSIVGHPLEESFTWWPSRNLYESFWLVSSQLFSSGRKFSSVSESNLRLEEKNKIVLLARLHFFTSQQFAKMWRSLILIYGKRKFANVLHI